MTIVTDEDVLGEIVQRSLQVSFCKYYLLNNHHSINRTWDRSIIFYRNQIRVRSSYSLFRFVLSKNKSRLNYRNCKGF